MIHRVNITGAMKSEADQHARKTVAALKRRGSKQYTGVEYPYSFYVGYLGEIVFLEFLKAERVHGIYRRRADGVADNRPEFEIVVASEQTVQIDTKTASKPFHRRIMLPAAQFASYDADYYVGIRLNEDVGEVHGYCTKAEFLLEQNGFDDQRAPTMYAYLAKLHEIRELWHTT